MTAPRQMILDLAEQGRIAPQQVRRALVLTGAYTKEDAEQWIAEYNEALSEVPKAADGC